jgi:hypothetical protein
MMNRPRYRTCIVRAWHETESGSAQVRWRLALEAPSTGVREGFASFEEMVDALWRYLAVDEVEGSASQQGGEANDAPQ